MAGLTPGKIVLLVASVVALGASLFFVLGRDDGVDLADKVVMVDVKTGELFYVPYSKGRNQRSPVIPEINPDTNQETLFPVRREGDGWKIIPHYFNDELRELVDDAVVPDFDDGSVIQVNDNLRRLW